MLARRSVMTMLVIVALVAIVGLVTLSPFALAGIAHFRNDWLQLSNIGQTYGAISAILSGLALVGILASLQYQARDSRNSHEQMGRTFQFELIKLELEDPSLLSAMGAPWGLDIPSDSTSLREFLYVQMWVSFWASIYATGGMKASVARSLASSELFKGRAGRSYWSAVGRQQIASSKGRYNKFFRLLEDEYRKAVSGDPSIDSAVAFEGSPASLSGMTPQIGKNFIDRVPALLIAALFGMLAGRILWRDKKIK